MSDIFKTSNALQGNMEMCMAWAESELALQHSLGLAVMLVDEEWHLEEREIIVSGLLILFVTSIKRKLVFSTLLQFVCHLLVPILWFTYLYIFLALDILAFWD